MSPRGKGLSAKPSPPDYSREQLVGDIVTFVESIGEPVGLMGHSSGATLALEAAAYTDAVSALALYEPNLTEFADEEIIARYADAAERGRRAAEQGEPAAAARIFFEDLALANDQELAAVLAAGVHELLAPNIPRSLAERLSDVSVREIAGVGHLAPQLAADPVAAELVRFFTTTRAPQPTATAE